MSFSQTVDPRTSDLTALIENIVEQVLGRTFNKQLTSWVVNNPRISSRFIYQRESEGGGGSKVVGSIARLGNMLYSVGKTSEDYFKDVTGKNIAGQYKDFGGKLSAAAGLVNAYQTGDPIGGAMSGAQLASAFSFNPVVGAAVGLLAGLFGKKQEIDRWEKPKFTPAKQAYNKLFTMDRGEEDLYYMPESFYFRTGSTGLRMLTVKLGNNQFDDHIRDSFTNNYASQLQRGLVF